jgi:segregation and condensation protein A
MKSESVSSSENSMLDSEFQINLEFFSGPMDLLLHLVSLKEVPIEKVSLKEVLDQYLKIVISQSDNLDLEKASEYLVIAATLMVIKSKSLIPNIVEESEELSEMHEYSRFFEDLRARLIAFENTRLRAQALMLSPQLDVDTFIRRDKAAIVIPPEMIAEGEEPQRLGSLFLSLLKRVGGLARTISISVEPISIVSYMMKLVDNLKQTSFKGPQTLLSLNASLINAFKGINNPESSRNIVLGSFIAILELAKRGLVKVTQEGDYGEMKLELSMKDLEGLELESEFDVKDEKVIQISDYREKNQEVLEEDIKRDGVSNG